MRYMEENAGKCCELMLNYNCNARCSFCSQGDFDKSLNAPFADVARNIYGAYRAGYRRLGLTGGEPLLRPDIIRVIAFARSAGFDFIRVQTNGIKLADPAFCRALVKAGLTYCKVTLSSDIPRDHDRLLGVPGAYRKAIRGLKTLRALKVRLSVNILVNRLNYRRLPGMVRSLLNLGVSDFVCVYPRYVGALAENSGWLGVSLGECEEYFSAAADVMEEAGLGGDLLFLNVPPCFLKGRESAGIGSGPFNTVVTDPSGRRTDLDVSADAAKVRAPACRACRLKKHCAGLAADYVRLFGFAGVAAAPRPAPKAAVKKRGIFLSDNERCLLEILGREDGASTRRVLQLAKQIALCRDCADGNHVLNAARSLSEKGLVAGVFSRGRYRWTLTGGKPEK